MVRIELTEDQYALLVFALGMASGCASTDNMPLAESILELHQHIMDARAITPPPADS